jgi:hypothetical protein
MIMVTHNADLAVRYASRTIQIVDGRLADGGSADGGLASGGLGAGIPAGGTEPAAGAHAAKWQA